MYRLNRLFILCVAACLMLVACTHRELADGRLVSISFSETQLKTALGPGRTSLCWSEGDEISVYNDFNGDIASAAYSKGASIKVSIPASADSVKATYPCTCGTFSEPGFVFPDSQVQSAPGVLNGGNYPLVAKARIENDAAELHFTSVGSAFALNVFNPVVSGEKLQKVYVKPSQRSTAVGVSLSAPFEIGVPAPADKRLYENQVYACLEKGLYNKIEFTVRTDRAQYKIISNETFMDLVSHDFFVVNIDLAKLKVYVGFSNEDFGYEMEDVTLPSSGFVELVEDLPEDQLTEDIIPDFSTVGYHWGEAPFPNYARVVQLPSPSGGDDTKVIQDAIDNASEGTVIQFAEGRYIVDGMLIVDKNSIILRGSGNLKTEIFARGTVALDDVDPNASGVFYAPIRELICVGVSDKNSRTAESSHSIAAINVTNTSGREIENHPDAWYVHGTGLNSGSKGIEGSGTPIDGDVFCGSRFVTVQDASSFGVGENVLVRRSTNDAWIHDIKMDNIIKALNDVGKITQWTASAYQMSWERTVRAIVGNRIYFDTPLVMSITGKYGTGDVLHYSKERVKECGIENLKLVSDYNPERNSSAYGVGDIYHASSAVVFYAAEHCWVKNVETHFFSESAVLMTGESKNITVQDCAQEEPAGYIRGGMRYAFHISGGQQCLVRNCTSDDDRHQFVTASKVAGPNVFTRCSGTNAHANVGPHQRWATGTLYDNVSTSATITAVDAGNSGTGQGWQGTNQVFWCCSASAFFLQSPWVTGKNYAIGCKLNNGSQATLTPYNPYPNPGYAPDGSIVNDSDVNGTRIDGVCRALAAGEGESLYESQLEARLSAGDKVSNYVML